jgi:DNA processing protein
MHLLRLPNLSRELHCSRELDLLKPRIAIVGARKATEDAVRFAHTLAMRVCEAGAVVVSGGAIGIDTAAHRGALCVKGDTWSVMPCGSEHRFPPENKQLLLEIEHSSGALIWPFPKETKPISSRFLARNGVLVALSDALVVVQASAHSGSLNAAKWAREASKPVHIVCAPPWEPRFEGWTTEIELGAKPIRTLEALLHDLGLAHTLELGRERRPASPTNGNPLPKATPVLEAVRQGARHLDDIIEQTSLSAAEVRNELLSLLLTGEIVPVGIGNYAPNYM